MKTAIYARVSTHEQNTETQTQQLKEYCQARKWDIQHIYVDQGISGAKESRPEFDNMLKDAKKRRFDTLLVWKLDRLSRSLKHLLNTLDTLQTLGIQFVCYNDQIDTTTPAGRLMFQMIGAFAEFERELISQRVKAGLARAKKKGTKLGRPCKNINHQGILQFIKKGKSYRKIASELNISRSTVMRVKQKYEK